MTSPLEVYHTAFSTFKSLYTKRYKAKRDLIAVEKEIQNITQVNRYIEDKVEGGQTQEARLQDEIVSLQKMLESKLS